MKGKKWFQRRSGAIAGIVIGLTIIFAGYSLLQNPTE
jgi:hypothetical protein